MVRSAPKAGSRRVVHALYTHRWVLLFLFATSITTAVFFVAIRRHNVDLSFDQLSSFSRQVQTVGNRTFYVSEQPARSELISTLSRDDWAKISSKIGYVAFVFDDMYSFTSSPQWGASIANALDTFKPPGFGVVLFPCGCVLPNAVFARTAVRFRGLECAMIPGFVMPKEHIRWVNSTDSRGTTVCSRRKEMFRNGWFSDSIGAIDGARREISALKARLLEMAPLDSRR